jgi:hypothetical protein
MGYCILCAIRLRLEIKELAELLGGKAGRNSLTLKKLLCGIFPQDSDLKFTKSLAQNFITWLQSPARLILKPLSRTLIENRFVAATLANFRMPGRSLIATQERLTAT